MLSISNFNAIHWTATAFAYTSLVSGLLSTFFSFFVQQILSDLHSPEDVREWLTSPRENGFSRLSNTILHQCRSQGRTAEHVSKGDDRVPSLTAAATLTAPSHLLYFAITCLFVALGIYLGSVYTDKLGSLKGSNANLGVLIFSIVFSGWAIFEVYLPLNSKRMDLIAASLVRDEERGFHHQESGISMNNIEPTTAIASRKAPETRDMIQNAIMASIQAQEESLKAQTALLKLLNSQTG